MAMEARLALRQTQRLVMTPMLQQAIHLLQLSTIELQDLLQKELEENPLLEEAPPDDAPGPEGDGEGQGETAVETPRAEAAAETVAARGGSRSALRHLGDHLRAAGGAHSRPAGGARGNALRELRRDADLAGRPSGRADPPDGRRTGRSRRRGGDHREPGRRRLPARDGRGDRGEACPRAVGRRAGPEPRAGVRPDRRGGAGPPGVPPDPAPGPDARAGREPAGRRDPRPALRSAPALQVPGDRPGAQGGAGPGDRSGAGDRGARAQARAPVRARGDPRTWCRMCS